MKFVFASYVITKEFDDPERWLKRISLYAGIQSALSVGNEVISIEQINYEGSCFKYGVHYQFLRLSAFERLVPLKLHRYILSHKPDVIVIQGLHFPLQVIQLGLLNRKKVKIIAQHHAERPFIGIKKYSQRLADYFVDAYLFASKPMGMDWISKGNLSSLKKIHEVMEVSTHFHPINKKTAKLKTGVSGDPVFLWVGRLNENKDPLNVVKAFLRFAAVSPEAHLYMIYQTEELLSEIKQLLNASAHGTQIILVGKILHNELLYWFNSADFLLSGSHYEGSGTAICEAMACGCVPIVTDIDSFRMITDNGRCGLLYEVANENALLNVLVQTQASNIEEKQKNCLSYFKSNLSFEAIASRIQEIATGL
ncbi:glycosyltransferase family 4 protein [Mucilaginibacter sp. L196]|uniref:glycosyltransferase family 4 protein n=1 Tax=Mucilaginibacter sp. L196 TaxID=1641870 RepID=UPI00131D0D24|nr:glycosyltransferase family 4 protein [Mucilaginibacter sp. L196]